VLDLGMAILGLCRVNGRLDHDRTLQLIDGYTAELPLTAEEHAAQPDEVEHAALIIAFHRYYRHNVRFPDPAKSHLHTELIDFVESLTGLADRISGISYQPDGAAASVRAIPDHR
jgi:homoserine kinase type II